MNWQIHSGVAGAWNIPPQGFHIICGLALMWCADFGMLCTKLILKDFGLDTALEGLRQEWDNVKQQRSIAFVEAQNHSNEMASE
jgi:hypothetical protein